MHGKVGNILFNTLNTFCLYGIGYISGDHSDSKRGDPVPIMN